MLFKIQLPRKSPLKLQCCKMRLFGECFQMLCKTFASCTAWKAVLDAWKNVVNLFFRCNLFFFLGCRTTRGFMHMKIQERSGQGYILGQFSKPFRTIAQMLLYYSRNSLPVKGIEHISLKKPVCEQLLWLIKKNQLVFWKRNFFLHTIRKVTFLSKNSILTKSQHFHEFFTQIFFDNFSREIKVVNS